eukprot:Gb_34332 [translate_table: standard]
MSSLDLGQVKKQAALFLREKLKTARLALTDVTEAELLTEEATNGDPWGPETRTMAAISQKAFEVDDYWRIVEILHKRLLVADKKQWRQSFKTLVLLEYLLTHGPESVAAEFRSDKDAILQLSHLQCVDDRGFDCGLNVRRKVERILELLSEDKLLKEERNRARKVSREIRGFGSFSSRTFSSSSFGSFSSRTSSSATLGSNSAWDDAGEKTGMPFENEDNRTTNESHKNNGDDCAAFTKSFSSPGFSINSILSDQSFSDKHLVDSCTSTLNTANRSETGKHSNNHGFNHEWKPFEERSLVSLDSFSKDSIENQIKYNEGNEKRKIQGNISPSDCAISERFCEWDPRIESMSLLNSSTCESNDSPSDKVFSGEIHPFNIFDKEMTAESLLSNTQKRSPASILDFPDSGGLLSKKLGGHSLFRTRKCEVE